MIADSVPSESAIRKEVKTTSIVIDISKKKCDCCVLNLKEDVAECGQYSNTIQYARQTAQEMACKYGPKNRGCAAVCESTANMCMTTFGAMYRHKTNRIKKTRQQQA